MCNLQLLSFTFYQCFNNRAMVLISIFIHHCPSEVTAEGQTLTATYSTMVAQCWAYSWNITILPLTPVQRQHTVMLVKWLPAISASLEHPTPAHVCLTHFFVYNSLFYFVLDASLMQLVKTAESSRCCQSQIIRIITKRCTAERTSLLSLQRLDLDSHWVW